MANEKQETPNGPETIPRRVQDRILVLCGTAGMPADQLSLLHQILREYANPQLPGTVETLGQHSGVPEEAREEFRKALRSV